VRKLHTSIRSDNEHTCDNHAPAEDPDLDPAEEIKDSDPDPAEAVEDSEPEAAVSLAGWLGLVKGFVDIAAARGG